MHTFYLPAIPEGTHELRGVRCELASSCITLARHQYARCERKGVGYEVTAYCDITLAVFLRLLHWLRCISSVGQAAEASMVYNR